VREENKGRREKREREEKENKIIRPLLMVHLGTLSISQKSALWTKCFGMKGIGRCQSDINVIAPTLGWEGIRRTRGVGFNG